MTQDGSPTTTSTSNDGDRGTGQADIDVDVLEYDAQEGQDASGGGVFALGNSIAALQVTDVAL